MILSILNPNFQIEPSEVIVNGQIREDCKRTCDLENETNYVKVEDLIYFKYLKDNIKNTRKEDCDKVNSKVTVERVSEDNYKYTVTLVCPGVDNNLINSE